jgi:hypothetical protein
VSQPQEAEATAVYNASVGAGASLTIITGVAGQRIYLHHWHVEIPAAAAAGVNALQSSTPVDLAYHRTEIVGARDCPMYGYPLTAGLGVLYKNNAVGAFVVAGYILYRIL